MTLGFLILRRVAVNKGGHVTVVEKYLEHCRAAGMRPGTIKIKAHYLHDVAKAVDLTKATESDLVSYLANPNWKPETRKSARSQIRAFYSWAHRQGLIDTDPSAYLPAVRVPRGLPKPAPESALEIALDGASPKLRAMMLLASYAGLRRAEIARLKIEDVHDTYLVVHGKGGKMRQVPMHPVLFNALREQIATNKRGTWVFPGRFGSHVSDDHVYRVIKDATQGLSPHRFRHRFATRAYKGSRDIRAVQELLGHSSPTTTARYVGVEDDALVAAVMSVA